jgi:hypothetical protein
MKIQYWGFLLFALCAALIVNQARNPGGDIDTGQESRDNKGSAKLVFFQRSGPYLPSVNVQLRNESGHPLLATTARGPWLVVTLPEGRYVVTAQRESGEVRSAHFRIDPGQRRDVSLRFAGGH